MPSESRPGIRTAAIVFLGLLLSRSAPQAAGLMTREEALATAYPGASIRAEQVFLTAEQQKQAVTLAGVKITSALIARYVAMQDGHVLGRAYVDTHVVRTKKESLLISLDAGGAVTRIDVTAFLEPPEYLAPRPWLDQYQGKPLGDDLRLQRAIRPIAGATLTAVAANEAVRRVLAIDRILEAGARR